jgi:23S rRNA U2552 (ribose-2'-O)-methylase RlmE/FtsJ
VPTSDGYRIGLYKLNCQDNRYRLHGADQMLIHEFDSKASAVLYAIFSIKNNITKAAEILDLDQDINKNYMDVVMLSRRITGLQRQSDWIGAEIREYRLEIAERRLEALRDKISKIHRSAKYNKIWD